MDVSQNTAPLSSAQHGASSHSSGDNATIEINHIRDLSPQQWKSGIAAWLGWLFDGLDMHLYVMVALPFVAELSGISNIKDEVVKSRGAWIQAAFLIGWAIGGGFFGRIADRMGRSRALSMTILTYALFTGLSYFAHTWWQLLIFRFLAAVGIGGEWGVGAAMLSETWPVKWRPWMAAVLQTGVNLGVIFATGAYYALAGFENRVVFLVGVLPAFLVLWIRRAVPEPEEWHQAKANSNEGDGAFIQLFQGSVRRTTILTLLVCSLSLTAHWAFMFWYTLHLENLPELNDWTDVERKHLKAQAFWLVMSCSIVGNFLSAWLASKIKYRRAIACIALSYFASMMVVYGSAREYKSMFVGYAVIGLCHGMFALFTMYMPPLFPTLLRTTGAGFCYNFGRIAAGLGTVFFGIFSKVGDYRNCLLYAGFLFIPAAYFAWMLPELPEEQKGPQEDMEPV